MNRIDRTLGVRRGFPFLAALSAAGLLLAPAPEARAGDEFEDGFKDELGRLAAHEAVGIGRGVLAQILLGGPGYYAEGPYYRTPPPRYYHEGPYYRPYEVWHYGYAPGPYPYWRPYGHGYRSHGHHHNYHRHHHHHGCGH